jgi:hypothetical protein
MAKSLIEIAIQLGSKLGANTSKFLGTRSNVSFLGSGPKDGMLFQKEINPESFATLGIEKVLPDIESSLAYAAGGKLDDYQLSRLIKNLKTMDETINPTNVVEMGGGGIDSLRAKSGIGERQITEAASDVKSIDDAAAGVNAADAAADTSPLMSKLENRIGGMRDETEAASGIMETVAKVDLPGKRAASREFLVNSLKVGDEASSTTLNDVISAQDMKYIMEGGGGVMGDPIVLVQKYFGPRIAEMVPSNASSEEMVIFTRRVMNNVEDAKGFRPDEPEFDAMTATFVDNLADGGRVPAADSQLVKKSEGIMGYRGKEAFFPNFLKHGYFSEKAYPRTLEETKKLDTVKDIFDADQPMSQNVVDLSEGFTLSPITFLKRMIANMEIKNTRKTKKADGGRAGYAKGGLAKILEL